MPPFKKTKRMDRRLSHWRCTFCCHETALSEQVNVCGKCNGTRRQLGDSVMLSRARAHAAWRAARRHMAARCTNKRVAGSAPTPGERSHWIAMVTRVRGTGLWHARISEFTEYTRASTRKDRNRESRPLQQTPIVRVVLPPGSKRLAIAISRKRLV